MRSAAASSTGRISSPTCVRVGVPSGSTCAATAGRKRPSGPTTRSRTWPATSVAVVDGLDLERVILVGHSIGGAAAVAYAGKHPQRVAGMLLVGTPGRVPIQQADQIMSQMTSDYDTTMSGYWDRLLADATPRVKDQITARWAGCRRTSR